jgi:cytoskeletal protein RodZ
MIIRRRVGMPLLRGAIVGGAAYSIGKHVANNAQREQEQSEAIASLQARQSQQTLQPQQSQQSQQPQQSRQGQQTQQSQYTQESQQSQQTQWPQHVQQAQRPVPVQASGADVASRLGQLSDLLQEGVLTPDEFARAKAKLLAG